MIRALPTISAMALAAAAMALACSEPSSPDPASPSSAAAASQPKDPPTRRAQHSGTTNRLQAISPVSANIVWASGVGGTYTVTTNGGKNGGREWFPGRRTCSSATFTA